MPPRALYQPAYSFSGGNQQKIVLAKSLLSESEVLLLFDPTRGVDIGTKHEIYVLMRDLAAAGKTILIYSTEISEIVSLCDRVLVLYRGRLAADLPRERLTEENILVAALGNAGSGALVSTGSPPPPAVNGWRRVLVRQRRLLVAVTAFMVIFVLFPDGEFGFAVLFRVELALDQYRRARAGGDGRNGGVFAGRHRSLRRRHALARQRHARQPDRQLLLSQILMAFTGVAIGGLVGAFNGFFVAYMRLQAVVVTLASMFIVLSLSLLDHAQSRRPRAGWPAPNSLPVI